MTIYIVKSGDTLEKIAENYGVSVERLIADNGIETPNRLALGQAILVRIPLEQVTVQTGDTLSGIAEATQSEVVQLYRNNPALEGLPDLVVGEEIAITFENSEKLTSLLVNGYTYPGIDRTVLRATLPYLSYLTSFSYGFREDGSLIAPNDAEVLAITKEYPAKPILLLSTLRENGSFSSEKANQLLNSPQQQQALIASLQREMQERGFVGIDVDFEYVDPALRDAYAAFIQLLNDSLSQLGFQVFVSLAPKSSANQPGLLYGAHDYALLGRAADRALLMTYEWGYRYSMPMAVAPINQVRRVVEYAVSEIPASKIFLGIPNYGYDWPLPYIEGETEASSLSNTEAISLAARYGAEIQYDPIAESPYFRYRAEDGIEHEVWFEDARSILAKLRLASQYNLGGISVWNMMRYFPGIWSAIDSEVNILPPAEDI